MAPSAPGPYFAKVSYVSNLGTEIHHQQFSVNGVGAWSFGSVNLCQLAGGGADVEVTGAFEGYVTALTANLRTEDTVNDITFFYQPDPLVPPVLTDVLAIEASGTVDTGTDFPLAEAVWSFKTPSVGGLRIFVLEGVYDEDIVIRASGDLAGGQVTMSDFILSELSPIVGRNGEFPILFRSFITKENDHLRNKRVVNP